MKQQQVEEIQGLYGPFSVAERVLQKAWLRRWFAPGALRLKSGKHLEVIHPGRWNHQEGPDFIGAHLRIDGVDTSGDVEVHFSVQDWRDHGHANDPAFRKVVLHAVFFDEVRPGLPVLTADGSTPETFLLGHFLREDLETFAHEDALLEMEARDALPWAKDFLQLPLPQRRQRLYDNALLRWQQKETFSAMRLQRLGWNEACHSAMLEVLGYRRNRAPMACVAERFPLSRWGREAPGVAELLTDATLGWRLNGLRPANQPKRRLLDYSSFVCARPSWPEQLRDVLATCCKSLQLGASNAAVILDSRTLRKHLGIPRLRQEWMDFFAGLAGTSRLDTWIVDGLLPLWSAAEPDLCIRSLWLHWQVGDVPPACRAFLREAFTAEDQRQPVANNALVQGALQLYFT